MKTIINSKLAPCAIGPYNQAVRANDFLFISGQIPVIPETGEAITDDIEAATERVMENIKAILNGAGLDFKDVVKSTIFITNMNDFAKINDIYSKYFNTDFPARETIQVAALPKNVEIEISMIALYK